MDENAIRERLRDDLRRYEAPPRQLEQVIRRAGRLRLLRVVAAAAVGGLMIVGVAGPLLVLSSIQGPPRRPAGTGPVDPTVTADVAVGDFPSAITTGDGSVWVAVQSRAGGENVVARIDPATNEVTNRIPVDGLPEWVAIGDGSLWIGLPGAVQRVDPETGQVLAEIRGVGSLVTFTTGAVWAVASATSIARIDSSTNQLVATVSLDLPADGYIIGRPVGTADAVWVIAALESDASGVASGELLRIDPGTNSVVARIDLEVASSALAVGEGAAWVARWGADRTYLTRIDTGINRADGPIVVEGGWTPFAVGAGRLWLMGGIEPEIRLAWLNLAALELEGSIVVGRMPAFEGSGVFDPETDTVWVAQYEDSVTRVDVRPTQSATPSVTRCVQARTSGDFDGDGTTDSAQFLELASGIVSCERSGEVFKNLSSQELEIRFGSGQTLERPFTDCQGGLCAYVFVAADLDGDGRDELAIDVTSAAAVGLAEFYRVDPVGIRPLVIAEPGDPPYVEPGPAILGGGFDSGLQSPIVCKVNDDGTRDLVSIHAENVGNSLSGPWEVHTTTMILRGERLIVMSTSDSRSSFPGTSGIPSFSDASPFENGCT
jgi:hypothetical protein